MSVCRVCGIESMMLEANGEKDAKRCEGRERRKEKIWAARDSYQRSGH